MLHQSLLGEEAAALRAVEDGDRHPPGPLARDAPVGAVGDHAVDPLLPPGRDPLHLLPDGRQRPLAQAVLVHGDEPLVGGAEQDRLLAAPAVRVGVLKLLGVEQRPVRPQLGDDHRVRLPDRHPGEVLHLGDEPAVVVHRVVDRQVVLHPRLVVVGPVARRRVDAAGPLIHGDVGGGEDRRRPVDPGVLGLEPVQARARHPADDLRRDQPTRLGRRVQPLLRQQVVLAGCPDDDVLLLGMDHDGQVGRQRPGGGGPDDHRHRAARQSRIQRDRIRDQWKRHVDRGRPVVLVLHLGLGQRRAAGGAPVHRLQSAVDLALSDELPQLTQDVGLVGERHRPVGVPPVAQAAQPLELLPLDVDELLGVGPAELALLRDGDLARLGAQLPVHLVLDGQPVAVPARHVGRVVTRHGAGLDDHVLEDLVQGVAHVDVAVGVGRSVVQDPARAPRPRLADPLVQPERLPVAQELRLPIDEVALHGKISLGEIQGRLVVHARIHLRRNLRPSGGPDTTKKTPRSGRLGPISNAG